MDRMLEQSATPPVAPPAPPVGSTAVDPSSPATYRPPGPGFGPVTGWGDLPAASQDEPPAASLVGSLSVFNLADVLLLLSTTDQTGELQVVSDTMDGKVWLARGGLSNARVGVATTIGQAVFELACLTEGWFYFTAGLVSSSGQPTVPVMAVLDEVRPQIDEWRAITSVIALAAPVGLAPAVPDHDIQIRSDQWRVLTTVGANRNSVKDVLDQVGGEQIVTLRTLSILHQAGLITVGPIPGAQAATAPMPTGPAVPNPAPQGPTSVDYGDPGGSAYGTAVGDATDITSLPPPPDEARPTRPYAPVIEPAPPTKPAAVIVGRGDQTDGLAGVAFMPPPVVSDPWAPPAESTSSENGVA